MNDLPRRTISDLTALYELEPGLRDVFVEGYFDMEVINCSLREVEQANRIVYEIDSVEVSNELLAQHGFTAGNKQRVIVLARELARLPECCSYRCLVDRDLDHWFGALEATPRLIWTQYCSLELYFFSNDILYNILIRTAKCRIKDWNIFSKTMTNALADMYLLRLADRELDWKLQWISKDKCLLIRGGWVEFDINEYIKRLLMQNCRCGLFADYKSTVDKWRNKVVGDPRLFIHGHDFIEMLAWVVGKSGGLKQFASEEAITRILVLIASQAKEPLLALD